MKSMIMCALALSIGLPAVASAAEADVIIRTHHRHHSNVRIINEDGQRLHHRHHGTVAFYDHGRGIIAPTPSLLRVRSTSTITAAPW